MKKQSLLILLGSGATLSKVGGVRELTDLIVTSDEFPANGILDGSMGNVNLFNYIADSLEIDKNSELYNFENLLNILEALEVSSSGSRPQTTALGTIFKARSQSCVQDAYQRACYLILRYLKGRVDSILPADLPPLARAMNKLSEHFDLKVFSLNYDDIPLMSSVPFFDGYMMGDPTLFSPKSLLDGSVPGRDTPWHIPLHGSLRFAPGFLHHDDYGRVHLVPRFESSQEASEHWKPGTWRGSGSWEARDDRFADGLVNVPMPMITGYRKTDRALHQPYLTYFHAFHEMLRECKKWLVVGYGGNDLHINAQMRAVLQERAWDQVEDYYASRIVVVGWIRPDHPFELREAAIQAAIQKEGLVSSVEEGVPWQDNEEWAQTVGRVVFRWASPYHYKQLQDRLLYDGRIARKRFSRITNRVTVCFDGADWALGDGLNALIDELLSPTDPRPWETDRMS